MKGEKRVSENRTRRLFELDTAEQAAKIKVIGLGGGGGNAVNRMMEARFTGVEFIVGNTDAQALRTSAVPVRIQLGAKLTQGLGAGSNPDVGREIARPVLVARVRRQHRPPGGEVHPGGPCHGA